MFHMTCFIIEWCYRENNNKKSRKKDLLKIKIWFIQLWGGTHGGCYKWARISAEKVSLILQFKLRKVLFKVCSYRWKTCSMSTKAGSCRWRLILNLFCRLVVCDLWNSTTPQVGKLIFKLITAFDRGRFCHWFI